MTAADELSEECHGLARITPTCFGTYPESTHPQNRSALSLFDKHLYRVYFTINLKKLRAPHIVNLNFFADLYY